MADAAQDSGDHHAKDGEQRDGTIAGCAPTVTLVLGERQNSPALPRDTLFSPDETAQMFQPEDDRSEGSLHHLCCNSISAGSSPRREFLNGI